MSATIGFELPAHPFFLATLIVPQSRSLPKAASHCHGFSKSWERNVIKHDGV